jgi:4-aminobutyrate aminotransferase
VACAAALATIELLENGLIENAASVGRYLKERLLEVKTRFPVISDVRGMGLMIGVELAKADQTRAPDARLRDAVVQGCFERGLLLLGCGESAVRFSPPLIVNEPDAGAAVQIFASVLEQSAREPALV